MEKEIINLTLDEKINLVKGMGSWHTNNLGGKLKSIHLSDGPHGLRAQAEDAKSNNDSIKATCFSTASASACSFDRELIESMAEAIAEEACEAGVSVVLGPGINMKRSPVCGRNFEYFSEDPYLAGELAGAFVNGIQKKGVATSLKHYAGNSQETHRMTSNSIIDERALREIYLRAFEKVVKESKPATIMASYNLLNGKPACENEWLLTKVLREEWGYEGLVMSDWGACVDAGACIQAGMDLEMPDSHGNHKEGILNALDKGSLSLDALDKAADRVINLVNKYPPKHDRGLTKISEGLLERNYELAKKVSSESAILLKNEAMLPLKNEKKLVIIGDLADKMRIQGGGSSHINAFRVLSIIDALNKENISTVFYQGYDSSEKANDRVSSSDEKRIADAIEGLKEEIKINPDIKVLLFGGLTDSAEGEGYDRESFKLPANQAKLFEKIGEITDKVIFVSFGGSPYDMSILSYAKAILNMYLGGEGVAEACVDILTGKVCPSGRLAETWPVKIEDTPCYKNYGRVNNTPNDVMYQESIFIGYRYYDSFNIPVVYPFGYGLSYTEFEYNNMSIDIVNGQYQVSVDVTNTGDYAGKETILVFIKNPKDGYIRANRELRAFTKINLNPGETATAKVTLDDRAFMIYDLSKSYITAKGEYTVEISKAIGDVIISKTISIDGEELKSQIDEYPSYFDNSSEYFKEDEFNKLSGLKRTDYSNVKPGDFTAKNSLSQMAPYSFEARLLIGVGKVAARLMTKAPLNDPETRMMYEGITEGNIDSVCNQSGGIISKKMVDGIIASANRTKKL